MKPKIKFYQDKKSEWRWTITASNGRIIDASSESFKRKRTAERNLDLVRAALAPVGKRSLEDILADLQAVEYESSSHEIGIAISSGVSALSRAIRHQNCQDQPPR